MIEQQEALERHLDEVQEQEAIVNSQMDANFKGQDHI